MSIEAVLNGWLPLVGGVSGLLVLGYAGWNIYVNIRRARQQEEILRLLHRIEAMLLVGRGRR